MIFIAGGGFYGSRAVQLFRNVDKVVVVDTNENCIAKAYVDTIVRSVDEALESSSNTVLVVGNASEALMMFLARSIIPDIVIPVVPRHLAGEVVKLYAEAKGLRVEPFGIGISRAVQKLNEMGVHVRADEGLGVIVASYMPFNERCLPECVEPSVCPITGLARPKPLYIAFREVLLHLADSVEVLVSSLVAPGIGGYSGRDLVNIIKRIVDVDVGFAGRIVAIVTACRCHGVANVFRIRS